MNDGTAVEAVSHDGQSVTALDKALDMLADAYARGNVSEQVLVVLQRGTQEERTDIARRLVSLAFSAGYLNARGVR